MDVAAFKEAFPEFVRTDVGKVTSRLAWATLRTPIGIWGDLQEQGIAFLAAHLLTIDPTAKNLRKNPSGAGDALDATPYGRERKRLNTIVSSGFRVAKSGI